MIRCPHCLKYLPQKERGKSNATPSLVLRQVGKKWQTIGSIADKMNLSYFTVAPVLAYLQQTRMVECSRMRQGGLGSSKLHYRIP